MSTVHWKKLCLNYVYKFWCQFQFRFIVLYSSFGTVPVLTNISVPVDNYSQPFCLVSKVLHKISKIFWPNTGAYLLVIVKLEERRQKVACYLANWENDFYFFAKGKKSVLTALVWLFPHITAIENLERETNETSMKKLTKHSSMKSA